jgi:26S proteasome regulatory subunit N2
MLSDNIQEKQVYALRKIAQIVDYQWPEISDQLPRIEGLMEEESFPEKQLAASIASKVFYYLQEHDEALRLALEAGDRFDIMTENQYTETLVHKCIDLYIQRRVAICDFNDKSVQVDGRMEEIVNRKFE